MSETEPTVGLSPRPVRGLTLWIGRSCGNRLPENGKKNPEMRKS